MEDVAEVKRDRARDLYGDSNRGCHCDAFVEFFTLCLRRKKLHILEIKEQNK